jgi:cystathionine gamma-synthase
MTSQSAPGQLSGTQLVHGDHGPGREVAPSISVTSSEFSATCQGGWELIINAAFRAAPDDDLEGIGLLDSEKHVYSRYSQNVTLRVEQILSKINVGLILGVIAPCLIFRSKDMQSRMHRDWLLRFQ